MTDKTKAIYEQMQPLLDEYTKLHSTELENVGVSVEIEGIKAIDLAEKVLKLQETKLKPIYEEGQVLMERKEELEAEYKKLNEELKELEDRSQGFVQAKGVLMNRLSPMLQKQMAGKLTEFQEMQTIARGEGGKPMIKIGDYLTAFVNSRRKQKIKAEQEQAKDNEKLDSVSPKMRMSNVDDTNEE